MSRMKILNKYVVVSEVCQTKPLNETSILQDAPSEHFVCSYDLLNSFSFSSQ